MIDDKDLLQLTEKGITKEQLKSQLAIFESGTQYLELESVANVDNRGILVPSPLERKAYAEVWERYIENGEHSIVKFVPASGAASRMFKDLFSFVERENNEELTTEFEKTFFSNLHRAAFYQELDNLLSQRHQKNIQELISEKQYQLIVKTLLEKDGLNYGNLPKGLLKFHSYAETARTPFEEHLMEATLYAKDAQGKASLHFTISPEHRPLFEAIAKTATKALGTLTNTHFEVSFSEQKSETDTVAVEGNNTPFRQADGSLLFRPGGHGALIENLNDLNADIVFIKNIDNVVPDHLKESTVENKKLLAGILIQLQTRVFEYLQELEEGNVADERLQEMLTFLENDLHCTSLAAKTYEGLELMDYLYCKFNRPMRVCGMVSNVGEPGGGPFFAYNADGSVSLQILESSQIDFSVPTKAEMFHNGTHFNPVDLVCSLKDFEGNSFDLKEFIDPTTIFISHKSKDGKELKALELPGLWNGAMSDWNTVFVEVPLATFNPVKIVNDLFRPQHQPA